MAINTFLFDEDDVALQKRVNDLLDWGLLLAVVGVLGMGLISIYSATYETGASSFFTRQLWYSVVGIVVAVGLFFVPERWMNQLSIPMYGVGIIMLVAVLTPLGHEVNGQRCWIQIGGFTFQPSELAKFTTLLAIARYASRKGFDIRTIRDVLIMAGLVLLPVALIMFQPDTGSATVFLAMAVGLYLWMGGDLFLMYMLVVIPFVCVAALYGVLFDSAFWFIVVVVLASAGAVMFRRNLVLTTTAVIILLGAGISVKPIFDSLEPYKQKRMITLFEPERNPRGEGYHVIQSILAVGSGGLTGKGFLKGTQTQLRYIPEQWTDFIFCVPTEEFGFVGGVIVIGLLGSIVVRAVSIAGQVRTKFASVIAIGFGALLLYHTTVNIGMSIGLFPVMGIPLPFLSAGGTALIVYLSLVGMLLNFYKTRRRRAGRA
ncbi:MAG: rod shape-determining protein RodA [Ignavibacteria bacterium]|nr:rod shape-determining protein RodA [Ignavibacteria bacterium]